jgi:type I restriction enzyme M protein
LDKDFGGTFLNLALFLPFCLYFHKQFFKNLNTDQLRKLVIPLPPIHIQQVIVGRIKSESVIVESNRRLIEIYQAKIKKIIEQIWQE